VKIDENLPINLSEGSKGDAREHAAAALNTNSRYVSDAKNLEEEAPDLFQQVQQGEITIPEARNFPSNVRELINRQRTSVRF
jgi:hypothetical protein